MDIEDFMDTWRIIVILQFIDILWDKVYVLGQRKGKFYHTIPKLNTFDAETVMWVKWGDVKEINTKTKDDVHVTYMRFVRMGLIVCVRIESTCPVCETEIDPCKTKWGVKYVNEVKFEVTGMEI